MVVFKFVVVLCARVVSGSVMSGLVCFEGVSGVVVALWDGTVTD